MTENVYEHFETDPDLETAGAWETFGPIEFLLARSGGANTKFDKLVREASEAHTQSDGSVRIDDPEEDRMIMATVLAKTCVLGMKGATDRDGKPLKFSEANVLQLFKDLPVLYGQVRRRCDDWQKYRKHRNESDAKN